MLRYCTYDLIKLEEVRFTSEFVFKFLVRNKLAITIQQVLYRQNIVVKPFTNSSHCNNGGFSILKNILEFTKVNILEFTVNVHVKD